MQFIRHSPRSNVCETQTKQQTIVIFLLWSSSIHCILYICRVYPDPERYPKTNNQTWLQNVAIQQYPKRLFFSPSRIHAKPKGNRKLNTHNKNCCCNQIAYDYRKILQFCVAVLRTRACVPILILCIYLYYCYWVNRNQFVDSFSMRHWVFVRLLACGLPVSARTFIHSIRFNGRLWFFDCCCLSIVAQCQTQPCTADTHSAHTTTKHTNVRRPYSIPLIKKTRFVSRLPCHASMP